MVVIFNLMLLSSELDTLTLNMVNKYVVGSVSVGLQKSQINF